MVYGVDFFRKYIDTLAAKQSLPPVAIYENPETGESVEIFPRGRGYYGDAGDWDFERPDLRTLKQQLKEWGFTELVHGTLLTEFYNQQLQDNDATSQASVGWGDAEGSQHKRFQKLLDIGVCEGDSILDVGCGVGHLYEYCGNRIEYQGVDPNTLYIEKAKEIYPEGIFTEGTLKDVPGTFDWALMSGIFNMDFPRKEMIETINLAVSKVNNGVAFNFLTGKENPDSILEFYSPRDITEIFESHSPEIVEDYGVVDDFTVYIRK